MDIEIKKADSTYLKDIQNLNNQLFELEYNNFDSALKVGWTFEEKGTSYFKDMLENEIVYIALDKDNVVGYLAGSINIQGSYVTKSLAEVDNMFVLEEYRKYGIGTKLIGKFKEYCLQNKIEELKVTASAKNINAISFYKKNGFNEFETTLKQEVKSNNFEKIIHKTLDYSFANSWLEKLKKYWWSKDIKKATSLFAKTTFYQETPFMKPYTTFDEIKQEWQHIKNQDIKNIEFKILAIDKNVLIVEWLFERDITTYSGIYEIKFDDNLECTYFKSWEMER